MDKELIAPCGMNCALCSSYLAQKNNIPRERGKFTHCIGCRPRGKKCSMLTKHCELLRKDKIEFCFECKDFPCRQLKHLDARYRKNYNYSMIESLTYIKANGIKHFLKHLEKKHSCLECGEMKSVHNGKCFKCEKVISWRE